MIPPFCSFVPGLPWLLVSFVGPYKFFNVLFNSVKSIIGVLIEITLELWIVLDSMDNKNIISSNPLIKHNFLYII